MSKIKNISGFPEWLPAQKLIEDSVIANIKTVYQSYGYVPIETPAVELLSTLTGSAGLEKEIYVIKRMAAKAEDEAELGLHFDLTVPLARYVAQHFNELKFPFKRYQLQKVWRGERPQKGRAREFYQFDIDVIGIQELPICFDAEIISILDQVFCELKLEEHLIKLNNRKILNGCYLSLGLSDQQTEQAIIIVDKLDKLGIDKIESELITGLGLSAAKAKELLRLTHFKCGAAKFLQSGDSIDLDHPVYREGVAEIKQVLELLTKSAIDRLEVDFSLARGMAYYTGSIFEFRFIKYPQFGSVAGGGRYADLASRFINKQLPGIGASIGLTRLMELVFSEKLVAADSKSTATVMISILNEADRPACNELAQKIRELGVACEVFHKALKLGKQIDFADDRGIPYVLFYDPKTCSIEVKDLNTKVQMQIKDLVAWTKSLSAKSAEN